ncbi:MAG: hypothetical protein U5N85_08260 [Arcicella sp.]|nr:hypothetical protein [Arcicella sp.]
MVECAWAASHTKNTYLSSKYKTLVVRMGAKKALIAVGHKILCAVYFILKDQVEYRELGGNWQEEERKQKRIKSLKKQLMELGESV